ncbi:MAG TPA: hypothetical protein VNH83_01165 [Bryobacteraceae bacterium]|nr:hypothetical protein [Bryobacteraceae bacterium]
MLLFTLGVVPALPQTAADHIVSVGDFHQSIRSAALARQSNVAKLEKFLSTEPARKVLQAVKLDSAQVTLAISNLSDEELSRLAVQSERIQHDVVAGEGGKQRLIKYVVIGAATTVLLWVILSHRAT